MSGKVDWKMLDEAVCQVFKVGAKRALFREPSFDTGYSLTQVLSKLSWSCSLTALSFSM